MSDDQVWNSIRDLDPDSEGADGVPMVAMPLSDYQDLLKRASSQPAGQSKPCGLCGAMLLIGCAAGLALGCAVGAVATWLAI